MQMLLLVICLVDKTNVAYSVYSFSGIKKPPEGGFLQKE